MKFVILIHSSPQPWGHPTADFIQESKEIPQDQRNQMNKEFDAFLEELGKQGELIGGEALGDPKSATLYRVKDGDPIASDGPYAETKEQFAGFFLIDVQDRARAEEVAAKFAGPGETIELRPTMWPGGEDQ